MKWIPIDEIPDEWKDGRSLMAWMGNGYVPCIYRAGKWETAFITAIAVHPTHLMEIVGPEVKG